MLNATFWRFSNTVYLPNLRFKRLLTKNFQVTHFILPYFQNAYVQLAIWCLERLRVRELYDIFPLETLCHQLHQEVDLNKRQSIFQQLFQGIKDDFMDDSGLELSDKIRILALLALSSDGLNAESLDELLEVGDIPSEER